jgi:putative polyhydroxyalkanoate system protein
MAKIHITRKHSMGKEGAKREVDQMAGELKSRLQAETRWEGDDLLFERSGADGRIQVTDNEVTVDIELGFALSMMKGMIENQVAGYLDERLK